MTTSHTKNFWWLSVYQIVLHIGWIFKTESLSTLSACFALPIITSSALVGLLMDIIGLGTIFVVVFALLLIGWAVTYRLEESRHLAR